jgi:hypothetical protein
VSTATEVISADKADVPSLHYQLPVIEPIHACSGACGVE